MAEILFPVFSGKMPLTDETKKMVLENICFLLNNFIQCSAYSNIIFCWVMHEQSIIDDIIQRIDGTSCEVKSISLIASKETLTERMMGDIKNGLRTADALDRSIDRIPLYQKLNTTKIVTDGKTIQEMVEEISLL